MCIKGFLDISLKYSFICKNGRNLLNLNNLIYSTIASVEKIVNNTPDTILIERIKFNITHNYTPKSIKNQL